MKRIIEVVHTIEVELDEEKFTEEFMAEFRSYITPLFTIDEHAEYLASRYASGDIDEWGFVEGYGEAKEFGIKFRLISEEATAID